MLTPTPYPHTFPTPHKLSLLEKQAAFLGQSHNFYRPPQTTFFHSGSNAAGVQMAASSGSGQDCTGVNDGSKNSVLVSYLADAWAWGAEIFCECEVRYIRSEEDHEGGRGGYTIFFAWHGDGREAFDDEFCDALMWVWAKEICILGAGTLGTSEILLRSQVYGLPLSRLVGQKVSGNGDVLSFGYNTDHDVNAIGSEHPDGKGPPCGPTITGIIDNRGEETSPDVLDGHVIEEGAVPSALAPLLQPMLELLPGKEPPSPFSVSEGLRHALARAKSRFFGAHAEGGSVRKTQVYLIMSHDSNEGIVSMDEAGQKAYLQFLGVGKTQHIQELNEVLKRATGAVGGTLVNQPFYAAFHQQNQITVHPLGGAIMSADGTGQSGVTNAEGQVFRGDGEEVYEGLICTDGAVVPTALGVNPLATISALAEKFVDLAAERKGWSIDLETQNGILDLFGKPKRNVRPLTPDMERASAAIRETGTLGGVRFTEVMEGYIHIGDDIVDFDVAERKARGAASAARLYLSVDAYSIDNLIERENEAPFATGVFSCGALSRDPLLILRGEVKFFSSDEIVSDATNLAYKLQLLSTSGETYILNGYKRVDPRIAFSVSETWKATTKLYTTINRVDGSLVGRGVVKITWRNFLDQLKTLQGTTKRGWLYRLVPTAAFIGFFAKNITDYFLGPLRKLQYPETDYRGYLKKPPPSRSVTLTADDGVQITLKVWNPVNASGSSRDSLPILLVPGASVDDQIYSLPTIPVNTVDYFTARGYTCYIPTLRFGRTPVAQEGYTAYDTRLDVLAAMHYVHEDCGGKKFYVIAHCVGAIATSMGLLDGTLPAEWIRGMTVSQVFFKQVVGAVNTLKGQTTFLQSVYRTLAQSPWFDLNSGPNAPTVQILFDQLLRFYPVGSRGELCNSSVCHRGSLAFGRLWSHANLNHATHAHLANFFGGIHMDFLIHLTRMGAKPPHNACDNEFHDLVTDWNLESFRGLKILFISGGANVVYDPVSTSMCYDVLRDRFGTQDYKRLVVGGYGHLDTWMGKKSFVDVYPAVVEHVKLCENV
ncbi:Alpha/Beta hydrolase protein [Collybia nuda]|uniref:Cholesterol oxidase n=1 Tax=Collybia nuda TaxID=64659 RepID=A0A9P6CKK1_9AGAR|nr:Alpha/Beta hydrolase protein [Collybia nuda]